MFNTKDISEHHGRPSEIVHLALWLSLIVLFYLVCFDLASLHARAAVRPELPRVYVDTTYTLPTGTLRVANTSSQFQTALNNAQLGDIIQLAAGTNYQGPFTLPNKSGTGWIYIRSSAEASLPAPGNRVAPAMANLMPKIIAGSGSSAITTANGAHHFRFIGIEVRPPTNTFIDNLISLGSGNESSLANQPHHIIFDRSYVHGDPTAGSRRGFAFNGMHLAVIDSYVSDFKSTQYDSQAICGWAGAGPFKIANNYLEAAAENVMFGGGDPAINNLTPSDIEIRGNYFFKPLAWKGSAWIVKNLFELKHGRRVLAEGNILDNNFNFSDQDGTALIWKSSNEEGTAPWSISEDVTFRNNMVRHAAGVLRITYNRGSAQPTARFLLENNLFYDISAVNWGEGTGLGELLQPDDPTQDLVLRHNTFDGDGQNVIFFLGRVLRSGFIFEDNIGPRNVAGVKGNGFSEGTVSLAHFAPGYSFTSNVIAGANASAYPSGNFFPASMASVGFIDRSAGNYRLSSTSPYKNAATDGKDLGVDMDLLDAATACTIAGQCSVITPPTNLRISP